MGAQRWSAERAQRWWAEQPWIVGCNFIPSTAGNQLEMWQAETFDAKTIERELGFAAGLGLNAVRVYLHDLVWQDDRAGLLPLRDTFPRRAPHARDPPPARPFRRRGAA